MCTLLESDRCRSHWEPAKAIPSLQQSQAHEEEGARREEMLCTKVFINCNFVPDPLVNRDTLGTNESFWSWGRKKKKEEKVLPLSAGK